MDTQGFKHPRGAGRAGRVPGNTLPCQKLFCFACKQHIGADVAFNPSPRFLSSGSRMGKKWESDVSLGRNFHAEHFVQGFSSSFGHTEPRGSCQQICSVFDSVSGGSRRCQAACGPLCPSTGLLMAPFQCGYQSCSWDPLSLSQRTQQMVGCDPREIGIPESSSAMAWSCSANTSPWKLVMVLFTCQAWIGGVCPPCFPCLSKAQRHLHSQEANQNLAGSLSASSFCSSSPCS